MLGSAKWRLTGTVLHIAVHSTIVRTYDGFRFADPVHSAYHVSFALDGAVLARPGGRRSGVKSARPPVLASTNPFTYSACTEVEHPGVMSLLWSQVYMAQLGCTLVATDSACSTNSSRMHLIRSAVSNDAYFHAVALHMDWPIIPTMTVFIGKHLCLALW